MGEKQKKERKKWGTRNEGQNSKNSRKWRKQEERIDEKRRRQRILLEQNYKIELKE